MDMRKISDRDTDNEVQSGLRKNLDKLGSKMLRAQRATYVSSQLPEHTPSILVDPGIEQSQVNIDSIEEEKEIKVEEDLEMVVEIPVFKQGKHELSNTFIDDYSI